MSKPNYVAPTRMTDAFAALDSTQTKSVIIAGGTDLLVRMRTGALEPDLLVDLRLLELDRIEEQKNLVSIGAYATHTDVLRSKILAKNFPVLVEAAREIAGPPIRNRGTLGGNLVNASPAADLATPLLIYNAEAVIVNKDGERLVPLEVFFKGPGETDLKPGEILKEIRIPKPISHTGAAFSKLGKRKAMAIAVVSVAARMTIDGGGRINQARVALGSVSPVPMRAYETEQFLVGKAPSKDLFSKAGEIARSESSPITDLRSTFEYREKMVSVLTRRTLETAVEQI